MEETSTLKYLSFQQTAVMDVINTAKLEFKVVVTVQRKLKCYVTIEKTYKIFIWEYQFNVAVQLLKADLTSTMLVRT